MNTIRDLAAQGKPVCAIARDLQLARNTVRKYLRGPAEPSAAHARQHRRPSKLDPYKAQIAQWVTQDHLSSCETVFRRL